MTDRFQLNEAGCIFYNPALFLFITRTANQDLLANRA